MCKIFALAGIKPETKDKARALLKAATSYMTAHDEDGFGYAVLSAEDGNVYGERWLNPKHAWLIRGLMKRPADLTDTLESASVSYARLGPRAPRESENVYTVVAHARRATSKKGIRNVHPFHKITDAGHVTLIHNGNVTGKDLDLSGSDECDSAGILNAYVAARVMDDPKNIKDCVAAFTGSYACAVMCSNGQNPYLDVWRNRGSELTLSYVDGIGRVWCTDETIVGKAAKDIGLGIKGMWKLDPNKFVRLDAITGEVIAKVPFEPATYMEAHKSQPASASSTWHDQYHPQTPPYSSQQTHPSVTGAASTALLDSSKTAPVASTQPASIWPPLQGTPEGDEDYDPVVLAKKQKNDRDSARYDPTQYEASLHVGSEARSQRGLSAETVVKTLAIAVAEEQSKQKAKATPQGVSIAKRGIDLEDVMDRNDSKGLGNHRKEMGDDDTYCDCN